jgi:hypothetical protein
MQTSVLNNWGALLANAFNEISEKVWGYADVLIYSAQIICGIFAFAYIGFKLWKQWSNGEVINFYSYLRPFVIGLVIGFFSLLTSFLDVIVKPVEAISLSINSEILTDFQEKEVEFYNNYDRLRDKVAIYEREEIDSGVQDITIDNSNEANISEETNKIVVFRLVIEFLDNLMQYVQMAVIYFFPLYVSISKVILQIIGPFMLALSILPGFTGNLTRWISLYLRIMIIPTIAYLVGSFTAVVNIHCYYIPLIEMLQDILSLTDDFMQSQAAKDFIFNKSVVGIVIALITIFIYTQIPKFASWIIKPNI